VTEAEAYEAVCQRWKSQWEILQPTVSYCFENEKFKEPPQPTDAWARVVLRPVDASQHTLGGVGQAQWLRDAAVWVHLYVPRDEGMARAAALVDSVRAVFEGRAFDGIDPAGGVRAVPVGSDGRWYEVAVISPVTYYETH
jgi:hypothetical protein